MKLSTLPTHEGYEAHQRLLVEGKKPDVYFNGEKQLDGVFIACSTGRYGWLERYIGRPDRVSPSLPHWVKVDGVTQSEKVYGHVEVTFETAPTVTPGHWVPHGVVAKCLACLSPLVCGVCPTCVAKSAAKGRAGFNPLQVVSDGRFNGAGDWAESTSEPMLVPSKFTEPAVIIENAFYGYDTTTGNPYQAILEWFLSEGCKNNWRDP